MTRPSINTLRKGNLPYHLMKMRRKITNLFRKIGINLVITTVSTTNTEGYEVVLPTADYAPWLTDEEFKKAHSHVVDSTWVGKYRCYELWQLVAESAKLKGALIEVGVWRGGSGALIAKKAQLEGLKDTVYLCDTFKGVVKAGEHDEDFVGEECSDTSEEIVQELLSKMGLDNVKILTGIFPDETGDSVSDEKFRFCHIDVDAYKSAKDVTKWVWPKLVVGGIIVYDDYGFSPCPGVTRCADEQRDKPDRVVIHNLNGHAIVLKVS